MVVQKSLLLLANFHLVLAAGNVDQVFCLMRLHYYRRHCWSLDE